MWEGTGGDGFLGRGGRVVGFFGGGEDMVTGVKIAGEVSVVGEGVGEFCRVVSEGRFWGLLFANTAVLSPLTDGREQNLDQSLSVKLNVFGGNH